MIKEGVTKTMTLKSRWKEWKNKAGRCMGLQGSQHRKWQVQRPWGGSHGTFKKQQKGSMSSPLVVMED